MDAVGYGESFGKAAHDDICNRENVGHFDVARIELNGATQARDCFVPMPQASLDHADRSVDVSIIRKTLLSLLEFRQCRGEIPLPVLAVITKSRMSLGEVWIQLENSIGAL